jgi:hypothetical protein
MIWVRFAGWIWHGGVLIYSHSMGLLLHNTQGLYTTRDRSVYTAGSRFTVVCILWDLVLAGITSITVLLMASNIREEIREKRMVWRWLTTPTTPERRTENESRLSSMPHNTDYYLDRLYYGSLTGTDPMTREPSLNRRVLIASQNVVRAPWTCQVIIWVCSSPRITGFPPWTIQISLINSFIRLYAHNNEN